MRFFLLSLLAIPALAQYQPALDPFPAVSCNVAGAQQCRSDAINVGGAGGCCDAGSFCCGSGCATEGWTCVVLPDDKVKICDEGKDCGAVYEINVSGTVTSTKSISRTTTSTPTSTTTSASTTASEAESTPTAASGDSAANSVQVVIAKVIVVAAAAVAAL